MVETKSHTLYDALIIVTCTPQIQIQRLMARESFDEETAQNWINSQLSLAKKEKLADIIIDNSSDRETLEKLVPKKWNELMTMLNNKD